MHHEVIERIIEQGVKAPSGDNSQPWSFSIADSEVRIFAHPEQDHRVLNIEGRGTYLSVGAVIENIVIAAEYEGYAAHVQLFQGSATAVIIFSHKERSGHHLYLAIGNRHTHRGPYLSAHEELLFLRTIEAQPHCHIAIVEEASKIRMVAGAASVMEETALRSKTLHSLFFDSIIWSHEQNDGGKSGLYIKTTELPLPIQLLFRLIRYWPIMRILNAVGFAKVAATSNASVYANSSACVAIILDGTEPSDYIGAGRVMQRVWLEVTHAGLVAQPLAGLLYVAEYVSKNTEHDIPEELVQKALSAREAIGSAFNVQGETVAMMLRIGSPAKPATARAARRSPHLLS